MLNLFPKIINFILTQLFEDTSRKREIVDYSVWLFVQLFSMKIWGYECFEEYNNDVMIHLTLYSFVVWLLFLFWTKKHRWISTRGSSLISFTIGGLFPLLTMILVKGAWQFPATIFATMLAMALTGMISAKLSDGLVIKAILRNIIIGLLTIFIHYFIGRILG